MSWLADFEPPRLHKQTWTERHDLEIMAVIGISLFLALLFISLAFAEPTVAGVV